MLTMHIVNGNICYHPWRKVSIIYDNKIKKNLGIEKKGTPSWIPFFQCCHTVYCGTYYKYIFVFLQGFVLVICKRGSAVSAIVPYVKVSITYKWPKATIFQNVPLWMIQSWIRGILLYIYHFLTERYFWTAKDHFSERRQSADIG